MIFLIRVLYSVFLIRYLFFVLRGASHKNEYSSFFLIIQKIKLPKESDISIGNNTFFAEIRTKKIYIIHLHAFVLGIFFMKESIMPIVVVNGLDEQQILRQIATTLMCILLRNPPEELLRQAVREVVFAQKEKNLEKDSENILESIVHDIYANPSWDDVDHIRRQILEFLQSIVPRERLKILTF